MAGSGNLGGSFSEPMTQHDDNEQVAAMSQGATTTSSVAHAFPSIAARLCKLSRVRAKILERDKPRQRPMRKQKAVVTDFDLGASPQEQQVSTSNPQNARALFRQAVVDSSGSSGGGGPKLPALGSPGGGVNDGRGTSVAASHVTATLGSAVADGPRRHAEEAGGAVFNQDPARLPEVVPQRRPRLTLKLIRSEFRKFDTDGNQLLDAMEFKHFISSLHPNLKPARWAECKRRFTRWDKDGSGFLDFEEFVSLYEETFGPLPRDEHDVALSSSDRDEDEDDEGMGGHDVQSRSAHAIGCCFFSSLDFCCGKRMLCCTPARAALPWPRLLIYLIVLCWVICISGKAFDDLPWC